MSLKRQKVIKEYLKCQEIVVAREIPLPNEGKGQYRPKMLN